MIKSRLSIGASVALCLAASNAGAQQESMIAQQQKELQVAADRVFGMLDLNGDGRVSLKEYLVRFEDQFRSADMNGDGKLTVGELRSAVLGSGSGQVMINVAERYFAALDGNRDNVITLEEFKVPPTSQFRSADINHDGRLSRREMRTMVGGLVQTVAQ